MKKAGILIAALYLFMAASSAWADATVESFTKFGGFKGNGAYEGTLVSRIQGDKQFESSSIKFTGAILSWAAGGSEQATITRIDKGIVWVLDPKNKTYTEEPIATFKHEDPSAKEDAGKEDAVEKPNVRVTKSEFTVKKTGKSETINGFACEEYLVTWLIEIENLDTKAKTRNTMTTNLWTTPETASIKKLQAEEKAFTKAYMKKIGMDMSSEEMKQYGMSVFSMMSGASEKDLEKGFKGLKKEMAKVKGYPIRTAVNWRIEDDQKPAARNDQTGSSGGIDISGGWSGILSGVLSQKAAESVKADENAPFFSSTTEVKSIKVDSLAADTFNVPSGYKLKSK